MLRFKDAPVLVLEGGAEVRLSVEFNRPKDLHREIVKQIFASFLSAGLSTSRAYWHTADMLGYESATPVQRIIAER